MFETTSKQLFVRLISACTIMCGLGYYCPNLDANNVWKLVISAFLIVLADVLLALLIGVHETALGRFCVALISSILIIYISQFIIPGFFISFKLSITGALIYTGISAILPTNEVSKERVSIA
ncbi:MAG: hypothetical protein RR922_03815 [Clostridia bacterium]